MKNIFRFQTLAALLGYTIFTLAPLSASAQNIVALGEVRSSGTVTIQSSNGQWQPAMQSYPLLPKTGIRTEDGSAALMFREGSRAELGKFTEAMIEGTSGSYAIALEKGVIAFNMVPSAGLTVKTASGNVLVNLSESYVRMVSLEKNERVLGVVSMGEKGLEVRSIAGRIVVTGDAGTKVLASGESFFANGSASRVFKTQAVAPAAAVTSGTAGGGAATVAPLVITGMFITTNTVLAIDNFRGGHKRLASPSVP